MQERLSKGGTIGFDGRCVEAKQGIELRNAAYEAGAECDYEFNAIEKYTQTGQNFHTARHFI